MRKERRGNEGSSARKRQRQNEPSWRGGLMNGLRGRVSEEEGGKREGRRRGYW